MRTQKRSQTIDTVFLPADDVILAIGQETRFPDRTELGNRVR